MKHIILVLLICLCLATAGHGQSDKISGSKRILVVSSYHKEYDWSKETQEGFCAAMRNFGYFDNVDQVVQFTKNDYIETSKALIKKQWMDSKRNKSIEAKAKMTLEITTIAEEFKPDLIFLGDDNAARYIGSQFLDTDIPLVFWGVNNTPVKYGLVDSIDKPNHNVTGIYQPGYNVESLNLLKTIVTGVKTFAVLSDETTSGRNHVKAIEYLSRKGLLPVKLVETVSTNDFDNWKRKVLALQEEVDAFFLAQYSGMKDKTGNYVPPQKVAEWYISHVNIPEAVGQGQFIKQGMLCGANDSGYNQGYEAVKVAIDILTNGASPATYPPRAPSRGHLMVNVKRAKQLGIILTDSMGIEEFIE